MFSQKSVGVEVYTKLLENQNILRLSKLGAREGFSTLQKINEI